MCARFGLYASFSELQKRITLSNELEFDVSYNKAPSALSPIIIRDRIGLARWGFTPQWVTKGSQARPQHNARIESASHKPFFREAWRKRRCVVPANGYYEWKALPSGKQPYYFYFDEEPVFFAGLWERDADGQVTFAILTQPADDSVRNIHHRMPVILPSDACNDWQRGGINILPASRAFMHQMQIRAVGKAVNNARNDSPSLITSQPPSQHPVQSEAIF